MGKLRLASGDIVKLDLGDGDYLEVLNDLSKRQFNELMAHMPDRAVSEDSGLTPSEGIEFTRGLFEALVRGWSLSEPADVEHYDALASDAAAAVDNALIEHFGRLSPSDDERSKAGPSPNKRQKG